MSVVLCAINKGTATIMSDGKITNTYCAYNQENKCKFQHLTNDVIIGYAPTEKQGWITGFNPKYQDVKAREGYYYDMLNKDYVLVQLLSNPEVASDYRLIYEGENARDAELKNNYQIDPQILSIVLNNSNGVKIATTRLKLKIFNKATQGIVEKMIVVTLSYDYFLEAIREQDRLDNPLGFKVLNYRVDEEIVR